MILFDLTDLIDFNCYFDFLRLFIEPPFPASGIGHTWGSTLHSPDGPPMAISVATGDYLQGPVAVIETPLHFYRGESLLAHLPPIYPTGAPL